jgi:iron complex outermembrane receptor protein
VLTWAILPTIQLKSITAAQGWWGNFAYDQDGSPLGLAWAYNLVDHHQFTQEIQLTGQAFDDKLEWAAGGFYFKGYSLNRGQVDINFLAGFFPPVPPFNGAPIFYFGLNDPANTTDKAGFVQGTYKFTDQLQLTAGARYTKEDKDYTFNHYNPAFFGGPINLRNVGESTGYSHADWKAGLEYKLTPDLMSYVSATTGFRAGGFNPRPFNAGQLSSYKPERLTEYEIGIKSEWFEHRLRANLAGYFGQYRDVVVNSQRLDSAGVPFTGPENVGSADIKGFELEVDATPVAGLTLNLTGGLTDFKWKDLGINEGCQDFSAAQIAAGAACITGNPGYNDIANGTARWTASAGVQYAIPLAAAGWLTPRLDAAYHSDIFYSPYNRFNPAGTGVAVNPAMTLLNARLTWESPDKKWSIAGFVTNLGNRYYYQSFLDLRAFGEGQLFATPGEPREWGVTFRRNF